MFSKMFFLRAKKKKKKCFFKRMFLQKNLCFQKMCFTTLNFPTRKCFFPSLKKKKNPSKKKGFSTLKNVFKENVSKILYFFYIKKILKIGFKKYSSFTTLDFFFFKRAFFFKKKSIFLKTFTIKHFLKKMCFSKLIKVYVVNFSYF